jgi:hypothetical protein
VLKLTHTHPRPDHTFMSSALNNHWEEGNAGGAANFLLNHELEGEAALCESDAKMDNAFIVPKKNMPKRSSKFGRSKSRSGNKKVPRDTTVPQEGTNKIIPSATTPTCNSSAHAKYLTKAQLPKQYIESEKKRKQSEKEAATALKKSVVVSAQCKSLAAIAQEQRKVIAATEQTCTRLVANADASIE